MRGAAGLLVAAGLSCGQISLAAEGVPSVTIAAERTIAEAYWAWSAKAPCEGVQSYALPDAPRGLTDLLLACRALRLGGYDGPLTVVAYPNYERALIEARKGAATIPAETLWEIDIDADHFYASEPVIRDGEFVSGLYTTPDRQDVLGVRSLGELQKYRTALPKVWHIGWETLQQMNLKEVVNVPHNEALFEVMRAGRVDFIALEFSSAADLSIHYKGLELVPIPGIKYGLKGTRRFAVSKAAPGAAEVFGALERGLRRLRKEGEIERAYRESGLFNDRVATWKQIF
jgi:ABC-type amino acid transport substrate-binding protein